MMQSSVGNGLEVQNEPRRPTDRAMKIGIASAVALGAVVSGFLISRQGRRFVRDVWKGRRRTPLEDRVLDAIWGDRVVGRRPIEATEIEEGVIALDGEVRNSHERGRVLALAESIKGVREVYDQLIVVPRNHRFNAERIARRLQR